MLLPLVLFIVVVSVPLFSYGHACLARVHACICIGLKNQTLSAMLLSPCSFSQMRPWKCAIKPYPFGLLMAFFFFFFWPGWVKLFTLRRYSLRSKILSRFSFFKIYLDSVYYISKAMHLEKSERLTRWNLEWGSTRSAIEKCLHNLLALIILLQSIMPKWHVVLTFKTLRLLGWMHASV